MSQDHFHIVHESKLFVDVLLPLAIPKPYTYRVPTEYLQQVFVGGRVEVQFGKSRLYSGLVVRLHQQAPTMQDAKYINAIIDKEPIITERQLELWQWIASYYCCTLGEVMNAALPAALKLASETLLVINPLFDQNYEDLDDKEYLVAEALSLQPEINIETVQKILDQKTIYPILRRLIDKKVILIKEELKLKYKPKTVSCVRLLEPFASQPDTLEQAFKRIGKAEKQAEALLGYLQLARSQPIIRAQEIYDIAKVDSAALKGLEKKEIIEIYKRETSRIGGYDDDTESLMPLSAAQATALSQIHLSMETQNVALLHGITGSGKTRIYIEMIEVALARGEQVLYLLPEIALTTQIIRRLQKIFGDKVVIYHSKMSDNERVELWHLTQANKPVILGARSALFLPFQNLKLIIIDEEHDPSYKQQDPAPRYNARDTAIYLAHTYGAKVLLGTATPSLETYYNVRQKKYGLIHLDERFGGIRLPEIVFANMHEENKRRKGTHFFSNLLIDELKRILGNGEQAILFQNRRGFAPYMECTTCSWRAQCENCDVSLTYHKFANNLRCHYCGSGKTVPKVCPSCTANTLIVKGLGTEKIEDELKIFFPDANIGRMDLDTVKTKNAHAQLINDFEEKRIDILVGTQMVTKGLDFDNVALVGVINADQLLFFPDFRAGERAFQLMTQVAGRAGRRNKIGKVIIQASNPQHLVLRDVLHHDFLSLYRREIDERAAFLYPPIWRLIQITIKHKKPETVNDASKYFGIQLKKHLGKRVIGPAMPSIGRVNNNYLMDIMIKLERNPKVITDAKALIQTMIVDTQQQSGFSGVYFAVDVDPY